MVVRFLALRTIATNTTTAEYVPMGPITWLHWRERKSEGDAEDLEAWVTALDEAALRQLMRRIPAPVLRKLRHNPSRAN